MINLHSNDLLLARVIVYLLTAAMLMLMLCADPFDYICDGVDVVCPGCGIKTGLHCLLRFDYEGAIQSNPASIWVAVAAVLATMDSLVGCGMCWRRRNALKRQRLALGKS